MFAIPGILGLLLFIYLRPQEVFLELQGIPFLYLFLLLIILGASVDLRLRVSKAMSTPAMPWVGLFFAWCLISVGLMRPDRVMGSAIMMIIVTTIYILIAQSIQTFRAFERVASLIVVLSLFIGYVAIDQSRSPKTCCLLELGNFQNGASGVPDGRLCERPQDCDAGGVPGRAYMCEKPGIWNTHTVSGRSRYRGVLQDPNEVAVVLSSALALLIALWLRSGKGYLKVLAYCGIFVFGWAVLTTGSRSGQLGLMGTGGAFLFWRYRWKVVAALGPLVVPGLIALSAGGGGREDADASSEERFGAWAAGFEIFRGSPVWGAGHDQFTEHHFLTAHNSYILILAELGLVGLFIFMMLIWITIKTPIVALKRYGGHPEARAAEIWSVALLACMTAVLSGGAFLSFSYHAVLWIFLGLSGSLFICIKNHDSDFAVEIGFKDIFGVIVVELTLFVVLSLFLRSKGML